MTLLVIVLCIVAAIGWIRERRCFTRHIDESTQVIIKLGRDATHYRNLAKQWQRCYDRERAGKYVETECDWPDVIG